MSDILSNSEIGTRFTELHPPLSPQAAVIEANRCLNCFDAPCTAACPTHIDVPGFIQRIASGNLRGSARRILDANILAGSCSRVCPVEVLCEGACVMHHHHDEPIQIGQLQRHAIDFFHYSNEPLLTSPPTPIPLRIACIGAGPASLACAAELCRQGASVTLYERRALPGGLNTYGVAEYKLRTSDSLREIELIRQMGVTFRFGQEPDLANLESEYDFIFLGIGLGAMQCLDIPGKDHPALLNALELIAAYKTGHFSTMHGTVAVIGAGNTAIDAAIAARRLGAAQVLMIYRRGPQDISAFDFEYEHAQREGVQFLWHKLPVALQAISNNRIRLEIASAISKNGILTADTASISSIECDAIIPAIGQSPLLDFLQQLRGIQTSQGRIGIDRATGQTSNPRYFAGGDCTNGGREVVDAVADGKRAALGILAAAHSVKEGANA